MTDPIQLSCPHCGMVLRVPRERVPAGGLEGPCPGCKQTVRVSAPARAPAAVRRPPPPPPPPPPAEKTFSVKRPDGRLEQLSEQKLERQARLGGVLAWDLVSEDGEHFQHAHEIEALRDHFQSLDALLEKKCWHHRNINAALLCEQCGRGYCNGCAPKPERAGITIRTCPACDAVLKTADPRWSEKPFWERLDEVFLFPIADMFWVTTLGIAVLLWLGSRHPRGLLVYGVGLAFIVHIVRHSAKGEKKMGMGPDLSHPWDLAALGFTALIVTLAVFLPIVLLNIFVFLRLFNGDPSVVVLILLNVPLGLFALAYYPMALGMAAVWQNKWLALRPDIVIGHILKIKKDYGILLLAFTAISIVEGIFQAILAWVPFLGGMVMSVIGAYLAIVEAHILGWTLYMNGEELGWD